MIPAHWKWNSQFSHSGYKSFTVTVHKIQSFHKVLQFFILLFFILLHFSLHHWYITAASRKPNWQFFNSVLVTLAGRSWNPSIFLSVVKNVISMEAWGDMKQVNFAKWKICVKKCIFPHSWVGYESHQELFFLFNFYQISLILLHFCCYYSTTSKCFFNMTWHEETLLLVLGILFKCLGFCFSTFGLKSNLFFAFCFFLPFHRFYVWAASTYIHTTALHSEIFE